MLAQAFPTRHTYICLFYPYPIFFCCLNTKISLGDNIFSLPRQKPIFALHFDHILNRRGCIFVRFLPLFHQLLNDLLARVCLLQHHVQNRQKQNAGGMVSHRHSGQCLPGFPSAVCVFTVGNGKESRRTLGQSHPHVSPCYMLFVFEHSPRPYIVVVTPCYSCLTVIYYCKKEDNKL